MRSKPSLVAKAMRRTDWSIMFFAILIISIVIFTNSSSSTNDSKFSQRIVVKTLEKPKARLISVQVVHRHGARTTLSQTPYWPNLEFGNCTDLYPGLSIQLRDETGLPEAPPILDLGSKKLPGGCRMGQLTFAGHDMAVELGTWLRERYVNQLGFLPPTLEPAAMSLRTTCIQRTGQTLHGVLSGLYPGFQGPVVVNASLEKYEFEYGKNTTCPALGPILDKTHALMRARDMESTHMKQLVDKIKAALQLPSSDEDEPLNWIWLYDELAAIKAEGMPLPPGLEDDSIFRIIEQQATKHEAPLSSPSVGDGLLDEENCKRVIQMSIGPLVWRLGANMQMAAMQAETLDDDVLSSFRFGRKGLRQEALTSTSSSSALLKGTHTVVSGTVSATEGSNMVNNTSKSSHHSVPDKGSWRPPLMHVYSGHDSTVSPLLVLLTRKTQDSWPPFTANLVFELWDLEANQEEEGEIRQQLLRQAAEKRGDATVGSGKPMITKPKHDGRYAVRVLYNRKPLILGGSNAGSGGFLTLTNFIEKFVTPYALTDKGKSSLCNPTE
ncbi:hypothetical protein CEUSTIGMA_g11300.t1 [Chlamydomonas eustigma]|uniref:Acid phosphatase n=1 Tax=Chlamydomonas eustigma TaxID=1157962 RepID=A0A250XL97_9CHLO|nr:hypothetical protein CEUSTIGMA_g11300.t1 [Chlamydomonas eustigma]|eukprot:GAX83875.1 hypothetical protein CEUSTIGMA_g11300.t1 [Chlamydomonas eustigma]